MKEEFLSDFDNKNNTETPNLISSMITSMITIPDTNDTSNLTKPKKELMKFSENVSLFINAIAIVLTSLAQFHLKWIKLEYPDDYEEFSFCFWRYFWSAILYGIYMKFAGEELLSVERYFKIPWLVVRSTVQFAVFITLLLQIKYFRLSTAICFVSSAPVVIVYLSYFLLKEKFYMRYIYGILICFIGTFLLVSNEAKQKDNKSNNDKPMNFWSFLMGSFWGIVQLTSVAFHRVSSKMLVKEKIDDHAQIMYSSFACSVLSFASIILSWRHFSHSFGFVFQCGFNGIIWIAFTKTLVLSLRGVDLIKTTAIGYLTVLITFILSTLFLGEKIFLTDVIGSLLIFGYNVFNTCYPVKDKA